ncbi:hypothetical protein ABT352_18200 [Streptosporangium sp. NPDC000563]|uniref:hypothetical protein n=1 Tax=Streptosporangium sp. NPDC000563 TaxID=3154366 RepID=UPI0033318213
MRSPEGQLRFRNYLKKEWRRAGEPSAQKIADRARKADPKWDYNPSPTTVRNALNDRMPLPTWDYLRSIIIGLGGDHVEAKKIWDEAGSTDSSFGEQGYEGRPILELTAGTSAQDALDELKQKLGEQERRHQKLEEELNEKRDELTEVNKRLEELKAKNAENYQSQQLLIAQLEGERKALQQVIQELMVSIHNAPLARTALLKNTIETAFRFVELNWRWARDLEEDLNKLKVARNQ